MPRMPARAAQKPKQDRARDEFDQPEPRDGSKKTDAQGAVPEPREKPKPSQPSA